MIVKMAAHSTLTAFSLTLVLFCYAFTLQPLQAAPNRSFVIDYNNNTFLRDDRPFRYIAGSMHYSRVHPFYWKDRLMKMRAGGLNAVQTYIPWNVHEQVQGHYDWKGFSDLGQFLKLAQESDLIVLARLGPYICGEWEFGGFPAWLLTENPDMILRSSDKSYLMWVDKWFTVLLDYIKPYLYKNGGPIAMVQIENEYGSYFACDKSYRDYLYFKVKSALGNVTIYTTDGCNLQDLKCGKTDGAYATVDFGASEDPMGCFAAQKFYEPKGPMVNSEYYTGWLDHWGEPHSTRQTTQISKRLDQILALGASVNMYMFIGGTNFGFTNGANSPPYEPVPTSYDYDAPLTESGDVTPKFYAIRDIISKYERLPPGPIPPNTNKSYYGNISMEFVSTIQDALSYLSPMGPKQSSYPIPMEQLKFYGGFILYRFSLKTEYDKPAPLHSTGIRDRAVVMVNAVPFGILSRDVTTVNITGTPGQYVDILVENQGRVGFATNMNFNTKGIVGNVTLNETVVTDWQIYPIYTENINSTTVRQVRKGGSSMRKPLKSATGSLMTPSIYVGQVNIPANPDQPQDTFLDPSFWNKGQAFVNDFNIGRYWPGKGPQVTLYIPKPLFYPAPAENFLFLLELESAPCDSQASCYVTLTDKPDIDAPVKSGGARKNIPSDDLHLKEH